MNNNMENKTCAINEQLKERIESLEKEIRVLKETNFLLSNDNDIMQNSLEYYRKGIADRIYDSLVKGEEIKDITKVSPLDFVTIMEMVLNRSWDDDSYGDTIGETNLTIKWEGIECTFYHGAEIHNTLLPAIEKCGEEQLGL